LDNQQPSSCTERLEKVQRLGYTACNHRDGFLRCYGETAYSPGGTVPRGMAMKSIGAEVPSKYPTTKICWLKI